MYRLYHIYKRKELKFDECLNYILINIENRKEIKDTCGLSITYRSLGNFWRYQKNYRKADTILQEALTIAKKCGGIDEIAKSYMDIGRVHYVKKEMDSARLLFLKALKFSEKNNYHGGIANANYQLSRYYNQQKSFPKSLKHLDIAKLSKNE